MKKIIITATAESVEQVKELLEAGVDRIYVGEKSMVFDYPVLFLMTNCDRLQPLYMR